MDADAQAKLRIARRAAMELRPGDVVNLGIGIPTLVADWVGEDVYIHTENGLLGVGPAPAPDEVDPDLVNAGKQPVTERPGSAYFDSAQSFAMIRGGHVGVAVMGGLQVDEEGNLANWALPGQDVLGVGGAMDLACGARRVIVTMLHTTRAGEPKLVRRCTLPLTARRVVDTVITELAVFRFREGKLCLEEVLEGLSVDDIRRVTEARFECGLVRPYRLG